jgi:sugar transferase (PEP-CTERM/EpsH1 system associated)
MNILFLSQRVPYPPNKGDKLRSFNEIKYLSRKHQVSLVCLSDNHEDCQYQTELSRYCSSVDIVYHHPLLSKINSIAKLFSSNPLTIGHFYSSKLKEIVARKLQDESFDLIFVYCSSMAQYVEMVFDITRVIDFVDVDSEKWAQYAHYASFPMRLVYRMESRRLRSYEAMIAKTFQHGFLVSAKETEDFQRLVCTSSKLTPILNGVDTKLFKPSEEPYCPHNLVFTGAMDYFANVEAVLYFAREILPLIQESIPEVMLYVVGSNPTNELKALSKTHPNIIVTGYVDRVQPYVVQSAVFVAPMRIARGVQNKILEAMAMGVPVVTTSLGFEGISATPEKDIFVEDEPEHFAAVVVRLMNDPELRSMVSRNARIVMETLYHWDRNLEAMEHVISDVVPTEGFTPYIS